MTGFKLGLVELKFLDGEIAFIVVPGIGKQDAADIPKKCTNGHFFRS
jgi:hypothetical protein